MQDILNFPNTPRDLAALQNDTVECGILTQGKLHRIESQISLSSLTSTMHNSKRVKGRQMSDFQLLHL